MASHSLSSSPQAAGRSFSEMDAPATFTTEYVFDHLKHYTHVMGAVLPGAWMLNMRVRLSTELQVSFGVVGPHDTTSDEQLRQSRGLYNLCVSALLALIDRPTVAGHQCIRVEEDADCTRTGVIILTPHPHAEEVAARLYIGKDSILLSLS